MREVENAPKPEWPYYLQAFNDLGTMRQRGMGEGPIPLDKIYWYAAKDGLTPLETDAFVAVMRAVDIDYLNRQACRAQEFAERRK